MNIIDNIRARFQPQGPRLPGMKAAADVLPTGMWGRPQRPSTDTATLLTVYKTNEVVFACIEVAAQALVDPSLEIERANDQGFAPDDFHPAIALLRKPNPYYNEATFLRAAYASMHIAGIFYVEKIRKTPNGPPVALYPLDPSKINPVLAQDGSVDHYEWRDGNVRVNIPADNVMVWRKPDLQARWLGISPLGVAMGAVAGDIAQTNFISSFFEGGGLPAGILTIKDRTITQEESDGIREKWRGKFDSGRGGDRRDIAVLDSNAVFQQIGAGIDQIQSEQLRSIAESRICMVFSTPPLIIYSLFGMSNATYSNLKEAWRQFWDSKLTPFLKEYRMWLTEQLLPEYEDQVLISAGRVRFNWDMSQVAALQDDLDQINGRIRANWQADLLTRGEARAMLGLEEMIDDSSFYSEVSKPPPAPAMLAPPKMARIAAPAGVPAPDFAGALDRIVAAAKLLAAVDARRAKAFTPTETEVKQVKGIDDQKEKIVARFKPKITSYLTTELQKVADNIAGGGNGVDAVENGDHLAEIMKPLYRASIGAAYDQTNTQLVDLAVSVAFDQSNPNVSKTIDGLLTKLRKDIPATTRESIRAKLAAGIDAGDSPADIADALRAAAPELSASRAEMIARTESADAYTRGALISFADSGVVKRVKWLSTLDERTSEICTELDGQIVDLGEQFPGNYSGPPAHPRCRSVLIGLID